MQCGWVHDIVCVVFFCFSPWGSSGPVASSPDDFTFPLGDTDQTGAMVLPVNETNPFNLSDLSSTLPPSLLPDNTATGSSTEVGGLYIETY